MSDAEFDVMDELYFLSSYRELQNKFPALEDQLCQLLLNLIAKGWVKCFAIGSEEEISNLKEFNLNYNKYNYLVTKAGLLVHNSK